jgi:hypothetical protein
VVDVLRVHPHQGSGSPQFVARLADPTRKNVLRLTTDSRHRRLWVVDRRAVHAYDLDRLALLRRIDAPSGPHYERFADLALDGAGNAFLLARGGSRIYRIDGKSLGMEIWLDLFPYASEAAIWLANRLLRTPDDRYLLVVSSADGGIVRVDLKSKEVQPVALAAPADLTCALLFWNEAASSEARRSRPAEATISAFDCAGSWHAVIEPADDFARASVRGAGAAGQRVPSKTQFRRES